MIWLIWGISDIFPNNNCIKCTRRRDGGNDTQDANFYVSLKLLLYSPILSKSFDKVGIYFLCLPSFTPANK